MNILGLKSKLLKVLLTWISLRKYSRASENWLLSKSNVILIQFKENFIDVLCSPNPRKVSWKCTQNLFETRLKWKWYDFQRGNESRSRLFTKISQLKVNRRWYWPNFHGNGFWQQWIYWLFRIHCKFLGLFCLHELNFPKKIIHQTGSRQRWKIGQIRHLKTYPTWYNFSW